MWASLQRFLDSSMFAPHGICLLWDPGLIWLHVGADALIALAYFAIPVAITLFVRKRADLEPAQVRECGRPTRVWARSILVCDCAARRIESGWE